VLMVYVLRIIVTRKALIPKFVLSIAVSFPGWIPLPGISVRNGSSSTRPLVSASTVLTAGASTGRESRSDREDIQDVVRIGEKGRRNIRRARKLLAENKFRY